MKSKRNYVDEILDKKSRLFPPGVRWREVSSRLSTINRFFGLLDAFEPDSEISSAINKYLDSDPDTCVDFDYSDISVTCLGNCTQVK